MNIEGTYTLQASPEDVSMFLRDQQTLRQTIPGLERLEALSEHLYAVALHVEHDPLIGFYQGQITVIEQDDAYHFHLIFEGEGQQSKITSAWTIELNGQRQDTVVGYKASVSLGKSTIHLSTPLVRGAIKLLIQEFFTSLAIQLRSSHSDIVVPEDEDSFVQEEQAESAFVVSAPTAQATIAHTIVHWLGLGDNDAIEEEQWVRRIRRVGITSILLLLVWIGTRLPRR